MALFKVTMRQVLENVYYVEAADEVEAQILGHEQDDEANWYNNGDDGDVETTVCEMTDEDIARKNTLDRVYSDLTHKCLDKDKKSD